MTKTDMLLEIERLKRLFMRKAEPAFGPMRAEPDGGVSAKIEDPMGLMKQLIAAMVATLGNATNYSAISGYHPEVGKIECIVQRVGKLSPHDARVLAEQNLARAVSLLREHGIPWDGPTEFLPDQPVSRPIPMKDGHGWLLIDASVSPNVMWCKRCGARHPMPTRSTAKVLEGMIRGFTKDHRGCKDGDDAI